MGRWPARPGLAQQAEPIREISDGCRKAAPFYCLRVILGDRRASNFDHPSEEHNVNRIEKLKNDLYSFEELDTLEKNATALRDAETLELIAVSRASKTAKGEQPKSTVGADGKPLTKRGRREARR
jgi:hypothetical protein